MESETVLLARALAAIGIGLLIGIERERSQGIVDERRPPPEPAGIRTFALVALCGNLLTWLPPDLRNLTIPLALAFLAGLILLAYGRSLRGKRFDIGITSEMGVLLTFILGVLTGLGYTMPAIVIAIAIFTLLHFKSYLHRFSHALSPADLRNALQFLIVALVILPLLPDTDLGPYGAFNPQQIWMMVVLICGVGFAGYAAIKLLGERLGLALAGILGGLVSSTAVTLAMSRLSRQSPELYRGAVLALLLACSIMFPRVLLYSLLFNPQVTLHLAAPIALVLLATGGVLWRLWRAEQPAGEARPYQPESSPLSLRMALFFALLYALILLLAHLAEESFGDRGILALASLSGLTDVDAISLSLTAMSRSTLSAAIAAQAILLACAANSLVKLGIALSTALPAARPILLAGMLPMPLISLAGALWLWW